MNRPELSISVLVLSIVPVMSVRAQQAEPPNAAAIYRRAIEQYQSIKTSMTEEQRQQIENFTGDPAGLLSPQVRQLLNRFAPVIDQVNRASTLTVCDFGGSASGDPFAPSAHLADMRNLARMLHNDLFMRLCDGDEAAVVNRTLTALRMGNQVGQSDALLPQLVGNAIFALGNNMSVEIAEGGLLTAEGASRLLPLFQFVDPQDPRGVRKTLQNLPAQTHWMIEQLGTEEGRAKLIDHVDWFVGDNLMAQWQLAGTSEQDWRTALEKCEALSKRISAVCDEPDIETMKAALSAINDEINRGDHGPLAKGLLGHCTNLPLQMEYSAKQFGETRQMLESVANGTIDPKTMANAANLYLRAIAMLDAIDRDPLAAIRRMAKDADGQDVVIDEVTARSLHEAQPIVDLLRQASQLKKCNFELWGPLNRSHPGMRDAARLLHADAARLLQTGQMDQAVDRLEITLRMAGHISREQEILFSLMAQVVVNRTDALVAGAMANQKLSAEHLAKLAAALDALRESDPFGMTEAVATEREQWRQMFGKDWSWETDKKNEALIKRATEFVNQCTGDDFLWFSIAQQEAFKEYPWNDHAGASGYAPMLDDIIAMDVFGPAMSQVQTVRTMIDHNDFERLGDFESPDFCQVEQRLKDGRADHQRIRRRLPEPERMLDAAAAGPSSQPGDR